MQFIRFTDGTEFMYAQGFVYQQKSAKRGTNHVKFFSFSDQLRIPGSPHQPPTMLVQGAEFRNVISGGPVPPKHLN